MTVWLLGSIMACNWELSWLQTGEGAAPGEEFHLGGRAAVVKDGYT